MSTVWLDHCPTCGAQRCHRHAFCRWTAANPGAWGYIMWGLGFVTGGLTAFTFNVLRMF